MAGIRYHKLANALLVAFALSLSPMAYSLGVSAAPADSLASAPHKETARTESPTASQSASKVVINIPSRTLWVYSGDRIIHYFPVGVGRPGYMTPMGNFTVIHKIIDPGWEHPYLPSGKVRIAPGENNPLGTRWIGFYQKSGGEYGMHGTDRPSSVGKFSSHGCVRMKIHDAEALFEMVDIGTPVEVIYQPVVVRGYENNVRVTVYPDTFKRGMPTPDTVVQDIHHQYPSATVDVERLKEAISHPTQQPVIVGQIPENSSLAPTQSEHPTSEHPTTDRTTTALTPEPKNPEPKRMDSTSSGLPDTMETSPSD